MKVVKRNGKKESLKFDKIFARVRKQTYGLNSAFVDPHKVAKKVIAGIYDGITSRELDQLAAETAASMVSTHPDYSLLASRLDISALHKETEAVFSKNIEELYNYTAPETGEQAGLIGEDTYRVVMENADVLNEAIITDRDSLIDYFGFRTLSRSYLLKMNGRVAERIQHMWMRVAVGIWKDNIEEVLKTYDLISQKYFTHATPTLFNSGTRRPQMSSCFLIQMDSDDLKGIYKTLSDVAQISKNAGGIGINIHNVRAEGSYIKGTNGYSNGLIPMLKVFNETARYVDQGGGKRKGSIAVYLEPWHADILDFVNIRLPHGKEEMRARDLFPAMWMNDLFFERLENDGHWSLFSPDEAPGLHEVYGQEFKELYERYEEEGRARKKIKASYLWDRILSAQIESGTPYVLSKDAINEKCNQKNLGTIKSSNLCCEITEFSSPDESAVCNLASIALPMFIRGKKVDHKKLYEVAYQVTRNLNKVIDENFYPTQETHNSNMRHRPIGIGVQGLADLFALLKVAFESEEAAKINREVFETIYFAAMTASKDLAIEQGAYDSFAGSPLSEGKFQFDLWTDREVSVKNGKVEVTTEKPVSLSGRWDWEKLRKEVMEHGVRNSLLVAPMPTASTSQILGNNECFEPFTANLYTRNTLSGEFVLINKYLVQDLIDLGIWNEEMKQEIIQNDGSVQGIINIPTEIKERYKTVWEIKQRVIIDMAAGRAPFICQSQSLNLHIPRVTKSKLNTALNYGHKKGLKTLSYYIRSTAAASAIKGLGTSSPSGNQQLLQEQPEVGAAACNLDDPDCLSCGA